MTADPAALSMIAQARGTWLDPSTGRAIKQRELLRTLAGYQVVLLGETHTVYEIHRWQLHVATMLHALHPKIAVGFEMFPRAKQDVLDEWVAGRHSTDTFLHAVDWPAVWGYDANLYLPLFHFCRQQRVKMLALNCRRPLVTRVGKEGWAAVPERERDGLTPAAEATPAYRQHLFEIMGGTAAAMQPKSQVKSAGDPALDRFIRAQQTWDRAFACNIARALEQPDPPLVIGIIGSGHLRYGHGTPYQLSDLGIERVSVLLPTSDAEHDPRRIAGLADAIFRLDEVEPQAPMPPRMQAAMTARRTDAPLQEERSNPV
ncbi:ChaN family lipoprotein [Bradyrhizobium sp. LHD-71]|uniref:ChaN family lipoprotein n=1 Tax=Bradyrhizobium sp. LHD-71 TaxID=3072141 RepID=UPI00280F87E7|nr:ChaN family lipoprotein [Bradyrhizobium sp. LHD-71]MDQ8729591.1 ChaN family lipoprotein [Bradyrhizobium sp. LHD-71]